MTPLVPVFPQSLIPLGWDVLTLLSATIFLEAEGESDEGKVAVGWVIRNRSDLWKQELSKVMLAPQQFSCWNKGYAPLALTRLTQARGPALVACWRAAAGALWRLIPDPTGGAVHYLNIEATKAGRPAHDLPPWAGTATDPFHADPERVTAVIGNHTFLSAP